MNKLVKIGTSGDVDNGKSTLIGRLFHDTDNLLEDQMQSLMREAKLSGRGDINLADITHGLKDERERGITIDVAHLYFSTGKTQFILSDCPGHTEYTNKMFTGTSVVDASLVLVDSRKGLTEQNKRHLAIAGVLGLRQVIVCVNKMDLVDYSQQRFEELEEEIREAFSSFDRTRVSFIPMSALTGANVTAPSEEMSWYRGVTVLEALESVEASLSDVDQLRMIVQWVVGDKVGAYLDSGHVSVDDEVLLLPSVAEDPDSSYRVTDILSQGDRVSSAYAGSVVTFQLSQQADLSRGTVVVQRESLPIVDSNFVADICWMGDELLHPNRDYIFQVAGAHVTGRVSSVRSKIDFSRSPIDFHPGNEAVLVNDLARVDVDLDADLVLDGASQRSALSQLLVIDPVTLRTVAAGLVKGVP